MLGSEHDATVATLRALIRPVTFTTVGLCLGFLVLTLSELRSQVQFGVLAAFTLAVAWVTGADVVAGALLVAAPRHALGSRSVSTSASSRSARCRSSKAFRVARRASSR